MNPADAAAGMVRRLAAALRAEVVETHISWVLLAPGLAYKLKKPVRLPFVDYSTLERRRHFCEEEVRLNRRLAPSLYLGVSRITGTEDEPVLDGSGPVQEYAVRMRRFPSGALFSERLAAGTLSEDAVDRFALRLAQFHQAAPRAGDDGGAKGAERRRVLLAALEGATPVLGAGAADRLRDWIGRECASLETFWRQRHAAGKVRECHGDLHLANVVVQDPDVEIFDCIEFDAALRWIDILEDAAFPLMDFIARGRAGLGWRFFNAWLEQTGEYGGLAALRLCVVGRALVRVQVEHLRAPDSRAAQAFAGTAMAWSRGGHASLAITHGLPGSGKSFASQRLLQGEGAVRLRSDVERKRLMGLNPLDDSRARGVDLYTAAMTQRTYEHLFSVARSVLQAGYPVIIDAAFLRRDERRQALALARELGVPFSIIACEAPLPELRRRIGARRADASEADLVVLEKLREMVEPLEPEELACLARPSDANPAGG